MMNRSLITIIFLLIASFLSSQSRVKVHFPGAEKRNAHIWVYSDYVSYTKNELGVYNVDKHGDFEFKVYVNKPKPIFIQVDFMRIQLFIEPNQDYEIEIEAVDFTNPEFYPKNVIGFLAPNYKVIKPDKNELNVGIERSKVMFASFVDSNYLSLVRGQNTKHLVDSFALEIDSFTQTYGNPYIKNYTEIQMAQLRLLNHDYSFKNVVDQYFVSDKIDLDNPLEMEFFNSFWSNYILLKAKGFNSYQLDSVINIKNSYQALLALLADDPLLKDSVLRELVIIRNIPQLYNNRRFNKKALINILYDISGSNLRPEHRTIASNVRKRLITLEQGSAAPEFEFVDTEGETFNIAKFEGKYIYVGIWGLECMECLAELEYTKELYEEFDDVITFVSISLDSDPEVMKHYVKSREYGWVFASLGDNFKFLNDYNISKMPRYILIDRSGKVEDVDVPSPSNRFSDYFLKMLNDKRGNLKLND